MDVQISPLPILSQNASSINEATRRSGNFEISILSDYFLSNGFETLEIEDMIEEEVQKLKEEVKRLLIESSVENPLKQLPLIDSIQRLGVAYHFDAEINDMLHQIYKVSDKIDENLHTTSLLFRLLRQQGYFISCEIFNKFTDEKGDFKESLGDDIRGILSLYEASHFRFHGEEILDQALDFTKKILEDEIESNEITSHFGSQVRYALKWPILKALPRLASRYYISFYEEDPLHDHVLLSFGKLDYNILQKLHQKELNEISRWWKNLNLVEKLSFARDRCVECYIWALGTYFEPKYSLARKILAKIIIMASILDDIYDLYGTLEELELFTSAIESWDINSIHELPEYMKLYYEALLDLYQRIEKDISKDDIPYAIHYAKGAMIRQAKAYFAEAKWYHKGYKPTIEEYLEVATISTCYYWFSPISFLGMGNDASILAFEWVESMPKMLYAAGIIGRIMNDIVSHKFEQERGDAPSAVECYMTQHGVSENEALIKLEEQYTNAWKELLEDYIQTVDVPINILMNVLNLARLSDVFYKEEDGYTNPNGEIRTFIVSLLIDPVPV